MAVKFSNNSATTLAANVTNSATTITVADGSVFPTLAGTDFTFITLEDVDSNREIVKLTAVSSNTLTIVRAQDGSSARAYSTNDKVELRLTAALLNAAVDSGAADLELNVFSGTGSQVNFTLSTQAVEANTLAYIDGVYQNKSGYSISGYVLTFSAAPDNGATIEVTCATVAPIQESTDFLINNFTGNNSTTAYTLSAAPTSENQCSVYISGVYQSKANFSVSGSTLTFSTAPPNGSAIEVMVARTVVYAAGTPDNNTVSTVKIQDDAVTSAKVDSTVATVAGTETLTNKTLTAPTINGDANFDSGTLFVDASANAVGVGTSSPAKKLSIKGDGGGSQLGIDIHNEGTAAGDDAVISFEAQASREWTMGLDRSSSSFVIAESSTLASNQRLVIDDGGNVLVGKTSQTFAVAGIEFKATNVANFTRDGASPINVNRLTSDGDLTTYHKAGVNIGHIGVANDDLHIGSGGNQSGLRFQATSIMPRKNGADANGTVDLGLASNRFKDAYLSGGVVFGPASASNISSQTLDSYEEGSWTPTIVSYSGTNPTVTGTMSGSYTKIGRNVYISWYGNTINVSGTTGNIIKFMGFPFPINDSSSVGSWTTHCVNLARPDFGGLTNLADGVGVLTSMDGVNQAWSWELVNIIGTNVSFRASMTYITNS